MIYQVVVILLLVGTLFKNKVKSESYNLLYIFNTLAAWFSLLIVLVYIAELFMTWYGQNAYEWYAFKAPITLEYWIWVFIINLLSFLLGLLMFFRKLRIKRWFTLLFLLSNCSILYERIVIFITSLYRDFLPSAWSTYYENTGTQYLYSIAVILLSLVLIYVWANKKRRLPFPSVFLK
jgi:molybdopterin-containing oxidoreductase family membrane subunit